MNDEPKSRFQFGIRTLFEIIAVAAFALAITYGRSTTINNAGRYQMQSDGTSLTILDAKTGKVWHRPFATGRWEEAGQPLPEVER
jgi:hypothetical protein